MNSILRAYYRNEGKYLPPFSVLETDVRATLDMMCKGMSYLRLGEDPSWDVHIHAKKPACYNILSLCTWKEVVWKGETYRVLLSVVENYRNRHRSSEGEIVVYFLLENAVGGLFYAQTKPHAYKNDEYRQVSGLVVDGVWTLADFYRDAQIGMVIHRCVIKDFLHGLRRLEEYGLKGEAYGEDSFFAKLPFGGLPPGGLSGGLSGLSGSGGLLFGV